MASSDRPDPTFGISSQPLAILQLLADVEPAFAEFVDGRYKVIVGTFPWYGGVALQVYKDLEQSDYLILTFAENGASDHILVEHWLAPMSRVKPSGPTVEDRPEPADDAVIRKLFPFMDFAKAVPYITEALTNFYRNHQ